MIKIKHEVDFSAWTNPTIERTISDTVNMLYNQGLPLVSGTLIGMTQQWLWILLAVPSFLVTLNFKLGVKKDE